MDNSEKLIRALIDKLGYEVERVFNYDEKGHERYKANHLALIGGTMTALTKEDFVTNNYKLIEKPKLTITSRGCEIGRTLPTHNFGESKL